MALNSHGAYAHRALLCKESPSVYGERNFTDGRLPVFVGPCTALRCPKGLLPESIIHAFRSGRPPPTGHPVAPVLGLGIALDNGQMAPSTTPWRYQTTAL